MNPNENTKTGWFLAAAALMIAVAYFSRPAPAAKSEADVLGKKLFPDFKDPTSVASLQVLRFDQAKGDSQKLSVAKVNGLWVIPTHFNYPADAKEHLATAATSLIDLSIIGVAPGFDATSPPMDAAALRAAHNRFGVVDPDPKKVKSSDTGAGMHVTMTDAAGHELASVIIGKPVADQPDLCYVRIADKDPVYIVKYDPSAVSVQFADWIERDLLKFKTLDLQKVAINDYSLVPVGPGALAPLRKGEYVLNAAAGDQPWKLVQELVFDQAKKKMVPGTVAADEELNTTNLESLKTALEDLKIVDVEAKPAAVPADLRANKLDEDTAETLADRGFYLARVAENSNVLEILSNYGDSAIQMSDGVRYVLRFGSTTGQVSAAAKAKKKGAAKVEEKTVESAAPGVDRYLFVTADFNQDAIPKPALEALPTEPPPGPVPAAGKAAAGPTADKKEPEKKDAGKKDPEKKDPAKKEEGKKEDPKGATPAKADAGKKEEPKGAAPAKHDAGKKDEPKKDDAAEKAKKAKELADKRAEVEKENKRKQEEYDSKVVAGKKHAAELSKRFAPWYYIIPGDTYAKIHLDRKDLFKKKEPSKDASGAAHEHDHEHEGPGAPPPSPAGTLEQLKKDAPK
jgi:hypothetical protein